MKRVVVLGGSGFVGRALCERLFSHDAGLAIVVPTRRNPRGDSVRPLPTVQLVVADVFDPPTLARLVRGADAVVNLIAILHGSRAEFERVHVELPRRIAAACRDAGVARVLHVSALGVGAGVTSHYLQTKTAGEQVYTQAGVEATLLRPSVMFGIDDRFLNLFASLQALAPVVPLAGSDAKLQPVWVQDVAEAALRCLLQTKTRPQTAGRAYECAGPEVYTLSEIVRLAGRWAGVERPQIALPGWAASLQAGVMELLPGPPLISRDNLRSLQTPNVATPGVPGLADLGITARAMDAVAPAYLADLHRKPWLDRWRASRG
jgi:uncharacterized protein YbjT (DUF2867 family)